MLSVASLIAANPPGPQFEVALSEGRTVWTQGEIIPLTMRLWSSVPNRWMAQSNMQDRAGRLNYLERFLVEPASDVSDPLEGLPGQNGSMGGISGAPVVLGAEPFEYVRELNEWVRFERPGIYRLVVTTRRVSGIAEGFESSARVSFPPSSGAVEITSNSLTIEIVEASLQWKATRMQRALQLLKAPRTQPNFDQDRRDGGRILRFLETPEAAFEMVLRLSSGYAMPIYDFRFGILSSPHRDAVLTIMEDRIEAPDQAVDARFIDTLATLAMLVKEGEPPPFTSTDETERQQRIELDTARRRRRDVLWVSYYDRLAVALPNKSTKAMSVSAAALSFFAIRQTATPAWHNAITDRLRTNFAELPINEQRDLLSNRWPEISGPGMISTLEDIYQRPDRRGNRELENLALRRLYELDHLRGRRLVLEEILAPTRGLDLSTLTMLDDASLPEAFAVFSAHLRQAGMALDSLILRYGDESLADTAITGLRLRMQTLADAGQPICVSPLHIFLLRVAPEEGISMFRRAISSSAAGNPNCLNLRRLVPGRYAWSPSLETMLGELLHDQPVIVKDSSAELLGRYGSSEAQEPLWLAFEEFHKWWNGRKTDLLDPKYIEGVQLERTLRKAIAQAGAWVVDSGGMARLKELCISEECHHEVDNWIAESVEPIKVSIWHAGPESFSANVGRFHLRSRSRLDAKFRQFPTGVRFRWSNRPGPGSAADLVELAREVELLVPGLHTAGATIEKGSTK